MATASSVIETENESEIERVWNQMKHKPKCIVFDLDYTLWPFNADSYKYLPPFVAKPSSAVNSTRMLIVDSQKKTLKSYPEVGKILDTLANRCFVAENRRVMLAVASKSTSEEICKSLLDVNNWTNYFSDMQIYSNSKIKHMKNICQNLALNSFDEILFFDDNGLNIKETTNLGVVAYKVGRTHGLNQIDFIDGLKFYARVMKNKLKHFFFSNHSLSFF